MSEQDAAFVAEESPVFFSIPYGGGESVAAEDLADQFEVKGSLSVPLYPALGAILLKWCITRINSGRTTPWTTTDAGSVMPPGDLASMTFYEAVQLPDGTIEYLQWNGCKAASWTIQASAQGEGRKWRLSVQFVGKQKSTVTITEAPAPAETDYPTGPYLLSHVSTGTGTLKVASARASSIESVEVGATNNLDPRFYDAARLVLLKYTGRRAMLKADLRLKVSPDDRASFTAKTDLDSELILDNGTNTCKIDFNAKNNLAAYARQFPLNKEFGYHIDLQNRFDPAAATDISVTTT